MGGGLTAGETGCLDAELVGASLPDQRLGRRLRRLLDQLSSAPGQPVPAACGDWAATKAAYRFFDNPRVTGHGVLAGHFAATAARCSASEGPILLLQDTTEFIYSRAKPGKIGFTKTINGGRYKTGQPNVHTLCGVLMHSSLAVSLAGTQLGLTAVKFWTRTQFKGTWTLKRHVNPTRVPIETKESYRWLENLPQSMTLLAAPERCVHVADRESDIYELFCLAQDLRTRFLVRVQTNRLAQPLPDAQRKNGGHRVFAQLDAAPWSGRHHVAVGDETACLQVKFATITTRSPVGKEKRYNPQVLTYVHALELDSPPRSSADRLEARHQSTSRRSRRSNRKTRLVCPALEGRGLSQGDEIGMPCGGDPAADRRATSEVPRPGCGGQLAYLLRDYVGSCKTRRPT